MSTFYVLPPRSYLREYLTAAVQELFPGMTFVEEDWSRVLDALGDAAARRKEVLVVYREELPDDQLAAEALRDGFGAEPGDEVVEVRAGAIAGALMARRWKVTESTRGAKSN